MKKKNLFFRFIILEPIFILSIFIFLLQTKVKFPFVYTILERERETLEINSNQIPQLLPLTEYCSNELLFGQEYAASIWPMRVLRALLVLWRGYI